VFARSWPLLAGFCALEMRGQRRAGPGGDGFEAPKEHPCTLAELTGQSRSPARMRDAGASWNDLFGLVRMQEPRRPQRCFRGPILAARPSNEAKLRLAGATA